MHEVAEDRRGTQEGKYFPEAGDEEELEGPMHHRVVLVAATHVQVPTVGGVEALVMVEGSRAQVPEAQTGGNQDKQPVEAELPGPVLLDPRQD